MRNWTTTLMVSASVCVLIFAGCGGESGSSSASAGKSVEDMTPEEAKAALRQRRLTPGPRTFAGLLRECDLETAKLFVRAGLDVNGDVSKDSPLIINVLSAGTPPEVVLYLLEHGMEVPQLRTSFGETLLVLAVRHHPAGVIEAVLDHGADPNWQPQKPRRSPLTEAVIRGELDIVRLLVNRGADINGFEGEEQRPIHAAAAACFNDIFNFLLEQGAEVKGFTDSQGNTPLHAATGCGVEMVKVLLYRGIDPNAAGDHAGSVMKFAVTNGDAATIRLLLEQGADPNGNANDLRKPLHLAAREGSVENARLLIEYGADVNAHDKYGNTPLRAARASHKQEVETLLETNGAEL